MNRIYCFLGASGSGKTTLSKYCQSIGIVELVSCTSRKPRVGEVEGKDYYFVDESFFASKQFIEKSKYAGVYHGLLKQEVEDKLSKFREVCVVIDANGLQTLKTLYGTQVVSIALMVDLETSVKRMKSRNDKKEDILRRVDNYWQRKEYELDKICDFSIEANQNIEGIIQEFESIRKKCQG